MKKEIIIIREDTYFTDQELSSIVNECIKKSIRLIKTAEKIVIVPLKGGGDDVFKKVHRYAAASQLQEITVARNGTTAAVGIEPAEPDLIDPLARQYHLYIFAWDKKAE